MKKVLTVIILGLLSLSTFLILAPKLITQAIPTAQNFEELWRTEIVDNREAFVATGDVDGDGVSDVALVPYAYSYGTWNTLQVIKGNGTLLWSKSVFITPCGVAIQDINGDTEGEILVYGCTTDGNYGAYIYAFDATGTLLWDFNGRDDYYGTFHSLNFINLDNDVEPELFLVGAGWTRYTSYALDTNGSLLWKFRAQDWNHLQPAISDINGDGWDEIVLASYGSVYILGKNGSILFQIPDPYNERTDKCVSCGDITGDGLPDIIFGIHGSDVTSRNSLHAYRNDGTPLWSEFYGNQDRQRGPLFPLLVDLTGDEIKDIVVYVEIEKMIIAYKNDGTLLWTFGNATFFNTPVYLHLGLYDINRTSSREIVFSKWADSWIYSLSKDGEITFESQLPQQGWLAHNCYLGRFVPMSDVNKDGFDELFAIEVIDGRHYLAVITINPPPPPATLDVDPHSLNLRSKGLYVTAYLELPEGYDVADINVSSILLNDTVPVDVGGPTEIGDYDSDGIPDLMVTFNRTMVSEFILSKGIKCGNVTLTLTGQLADLTLFEGSDVIRVKMPGDVNGDGKVNICDIVLAAKAYGSYPSHPRWNPMADENEDNKIGIIDIIIIAINLGKTY